MILLTGGFSIEMLWMFGAGLLAGISAFIYFHFWAVKTKFYQEDFIHYLSWEKIVYYIGFFFVNVLVSVLIGYIITFLSMIPIIILSKMFTSRS
ncbi:hypothetical protein GS399_11050 [Pedobacter sp. HMF7647]|uniref:Uncharacterized protein n=1 Tax=Hufsiella arboris TaxID=2695275 RepID=A0A7K1YBU5_9SPHI|nr:hypothetical protein [Hufsiella arboris]MXV51508.1 hypothetical protein [Hufsiella arboris]